MPGGLSDELAEMHSRRAKAEKDARDAIGYWAFEHLQEQTFDSVRALNEQVRQIIMSAVMDAYNMGAKHARENPSE